jgi:hypothetical protein
MKLISQKIFILTLITLAMAFLASPLMAEVYKSVDKDGNVTYTDKPPTDGTGPMELPGLSVVEAPEYQKTARELDAEAIANGTKTEPEEIPLRQLRNDFKDFAIVSPQQEESVWRPDGPVTIAWGTGAQMLPGMKVTVTLDGRKLSTTTDRMILVPNMERGEHTVAAELTDARNRRVALAEPVTFFIRQPGVYNRVRAGPGGG